MIYYLFSFSHEFVMYVMIQIYGRLLACLGGAEIKVDPDPRKLEDTERISEGKALIDVGLRYLLKDMNSRRRDHHRVNNGSNSSSSSSRDMVNGDSSTRHIEMVSRV